MLQTATLLEIIGLLPSSETATNVAAIATAVCAVLSWWFGKATSYYIYIMLFEAGLAFVVFLFFEFARVVIKTVRTHAGPSTAGLSLHVFYRQWT